METCTLCGGLSDWEVCDDCLHGMAGKAIEEEFCPACHQAEVVENLFCLKHDGSILRV